MDKPDYFIRDSMKEMPVIGISSEEALQKFIYFKNESVFYRNELLKPCIGKDEFVKNSGEHFYFARSAMKCAKYIIKNFSHDEPGLKGVLNNEMDQLMKEIIEFEEISGKTIKACVH